MSEPTDRPPSLATIRQDLKVLLSRETRDAQRKEIGRALAAIRRVELVDKQKHS